MYRVLRDELTAICGAGIYSELRSDLDERVNSAQLLPHPAVRRRN